MKLVLQLVLLFAWMDWWFPESIEQYLVQRILAEVMLHTREYLRDSKLNLSVRSPTSRVRNHCGVPSQPVEHVVVPLLYIIF